MKRDHINYLAVGSFVVAILLAFFAVMYFVTGRTGPSDEYIVHYDNVAGLKFGTGVFYEGYRVGQITEITPITTMEGTRYRLMISVSKGWKIPKDSVARVVASGLISAPQVGIVEGKSTEYLQPGDEISGAEQLNMFSALNDAASEFQTISRTGLLPLLTNLNDKIDEMFGQVTQFNTKQLTPFMNSFNHNVNDKLLVDAGVLIERLNNSAAQLQLMLGEENRDKFTNFLTHIDDVALNLNDLISRIEQTRKQMNGVLTALDTLATGNAENVASTLATAEESMLEVKTMMHTINNHLDSILYHAEGSTRHMHEFAKAIRDNPARLIRGSAQSEEE